MSQDARAQILPHPNSLPSGYSSSNISSPTNPFSRCNSLSLILFSFSCYRSPFLSFRIPSFSVSLFVTAPVLFLTEPSLPLYVTRRISFSFSPLICLFLTSNFVSLSLSHHALFHAPVYSISLNIASLYLSPSPFS